MTILKSVVSYRSWTILVSLLLLLALGSIINLTPPVTEAAAVEAEETTGTCAADDISCQAKLNPNCQDNNDRCDEWASTGECTYNPGYMLKECKLSCFVCSDIIYDQEDLNIGLDLGVAQSLQSPDGRFQDDEVISFIETNRQSWLQHEPHVRRTCKNLRDQCTVRALNGECETNSEIMKSNCPVACQSCLFGTLEDKCPIDPNAPEVWKPGDLDAMFERLTSEPYLSKYQVEILSSPQMNNGPWVITMDNVLSENEAKNFIDLGAKQGYRRSSDVGRMNPDGTFERNVNEGRTSSNTWCQGSCYDNEISQNVVQRLVNLTGIPDENSEYLQLLQYTPGQKYAPHHDYIPSQIRRQPGVRILTVYLYLNEVEAGGGTNFDKLDLTVMPKTGRALIWPSVKNDNPHEKDPRTNHQALPVEAGIKYGANAWFHQRDFKTPYHNDCK